MALAGGLEARAGASGDASTARPWVRGLVHVSNAVYRGSR